MSNLRKISAGIILVGGIFLLIFRQNVNDHLRVWNYQPSGPIAQINQTVDFSPQGTFYFYLAHPQLETAATFNDDCRRVEKNNPILGCYRPEDDTMYIFHVNDAELSGVEEVTAAHEMLHVAYERLSEVEKAHFGKLLRAEYEARKTPELEKRMAYYERAQPGTFENELHSILGTEFRALNPELEKYYARYFSDRQKVIQLYESYHRVFVDLEEKIADLSENIEARRTQLNQDADAWEVRLAAYNQRVGTFNNRADAGDFSSQAQFEAERAQLEQERTQLEAQRTDIQARVDTFNDDVETINSLGTRINQLQKKLDSTEVSSNG